ncbi:SapC family protein [Paucibacter sp. Y2R2-4]|uniref:SapC family protein n=1 Tax=Paucibacter sp. Y2R2-4 TaxID=2893553 RepID=UPI0021E37485|nr:SapC family protein [Paucibacter sp. Y2R2-4]MCV2349160.1 SapC family protein [Paucibacter sp. Y2R2-4]
MSTTPPLYGNLVPLDREAHKHLRLKTELSTIDRVQGMNSLFLAVVEFAEACKEYPIVFVRVGEPPAEGAKPTIAPLAVLGLKPGTNLFVKDGVWTGNYVPAYLRRYPFAMARIEENSDTVAVCYDSEWPGFSVTEGTSLFAADGQPTEFLLNAKNFLESFEQESERTRAFCTQLVELDLLRDMRFEATLSNGEKIDVEGFLAVDEQKLAELADDKVVQLHRSGVLALLEMHRVSMGNMNRLATQHATVA